MKKLLLALAASLLFAFGVNAHAATPVGANVGVAYCLSGSNWIPVLATLGSTYNPLPMPILLYGQSAGNAYPVACDTAGNLITPIPVIFSTGSGTLSTSSTDFVGIGYLGGGSQNGPFVAVRAGTVKSCVLHLTATQTGTSYYTATMFKNGASCGGPTLLFNSTTETLTDSVNTCTVVQGDLLTWQFVPTNTPTAGIVSGTCLLQ